MSVLLVVGRKCIVYAGRVASCPAVSHVEYRPRSILRRFKKRRDRQTDGGTQNHYITLTCCPLVSRVESCPRALLRFGKKDGTDGQTDGRQTVTLRFPLNVASIITQRARAAV